MLNGLVEPPTHNSQGKRVYFRLFSPILYLFTQVEYDFIGHYETMEPDTYGIMRRLGLGEAASNFSLRPSTSADIARDIIRVLDSRLIMTLYQLYHLDYELFGYHHIKLQEWANQVAIKRADYDPFIVVVARPKQ